MPYCEEDHQLGGDRRETEACWLEIRHPLIVARVYMKGSLDNVVCVKMGSVRWRKHV